MKIYISGKISGLKKSDYIHNFLQSEKRLSGCGIKTVNPIKIKPLFGINRWFFFMIADLWELRKCTHIAMQQDWTDSKGAVIEYFVGKFIFKQRVIFL